MRNFQAFGDEGSAHYQSCDCQIAYRKVGAQPRTSQPENNMAPTKKKAKAKPGVKFKDLASKKSPKGGINWSGGGSEEGALRLKPAICDFKVI